MGLMDSSKNKIKVYRGEAVSETRYSVNIWMERELPKLSGSVLNIGAGGSQLPRQLLNSLKVSKYITFDQKFYGDSKNPVDVYGSVLDMPKEWTGVWDNIICIEVMECVSNPFKAVEEMYRILKPGGMALLTAPFNVGWFGYGSTPESLKKKNPVKDYWRITKDGWVELMKSFSSVAIEGFGGTGEQDRYVYCIKAVK